MSTVIEQRYRLQGVDAARREVAGLASAAADSNDAFDGLTRSASDLGRALGLPVERVTNLSRGLGGMASGASGAALGISGLVAGASAGVGVFALLAAKTDDIVESQRRLADLPAFDPYPASMQSSANRFEASLSAIGEILKRIGSDWGFAAKTALGDMFNGALLKATQFLMALETISDWQGDRRGGLYDRGKEAEALIARIQSGADPEAQMEALRKLALEQAGRNRRLAQQFGRDERASAGRASSGRSPAEEVERIKWVTLDFAEEEMELERERRDIIAQGVELQQAALDRAARMEAMGGAGLSLLGGDLLGAAAGMGVPGMVVQGAQALQGLGQTGAGATADRMQQTLLDIAAGVEAIPELVARLPAILVESWPALMEALLMYWPRYIEALFTEMPQMLVEAIVQAILRAWESIKGLFGGDGEGGGWKGAAKTTARVGLGVATMGFSEIANSMIKGLNKSLGINIPHFADGSSYVHRTGLAVVHEGEEITPAGGSSARGQRGSSGGGVTIHIQGYLTVDDLVEQIRRQLGPYGRGVVLQGYS